MQLGAETAGILDRDDLRRLGFSDDKIDWRAKSGRWQRVYPRVFATFSGPLPYRARLHAAIKYAGTGAVLSHGTAACEHRFGRRSPLIHVTVPYGRRVTPVPGLKVHRSRTLTDADVWNNDLPFTTVERTVLDLMNQARNSSGALAVIADAVRSRRTTHAWIRVALESAPRTRWRSNALEALPDVGRGAHSLLEIREAKERRIHGLPPGRRQLRRDNDGVEYLDVIIEELRVHVELDGRLGHDRTEEEWRDMRRDNRSEVLRYRHLRYGWGDLDDQPCEVMAQQAEILWQQGWTGQFRRCRRCPPHLPTGP